jgi:hypothetical protein
MRRRELIALTSGAAVFRPLEVSAQQSVPAIGFLHQGAQAPTRLMKSFRRGLSESGLVEGRNYTIENRSADGQYDRLPTLGAEQVAWQVALLTFSPPRLPQRPQANRMGENVDHAPAPPSIARTRIRATSPRPGEPWSCKIAVS